MVLSVADLACHGCGGLSSSLFALNWRRLGIGTRSSLFGRSSSCLAVSDPWVICGLLASYVLIFVEPSDGVKQMRLVFIDLFYSGCILLCFIRMLGGQMVFVPVPFCLFLLVLHFHEHTNVMDTSIHIWCF